MCLFIRKSDYLFYLFIYFWILWTLSAIAIDNELRIIKSDCYERMAIGQRLSPKDIYKMTEINTVKDCQQECTKEEKSCKAFSFGISVKGNGTCELSHNTVRETADLRPIGTIEDTDYDLYIKKIDCSIVIDQTLGFGGYPSENNQYLHKPASDTYSNVHPNHPPQSQTDIYNPPHQNNPSSYNSEINSGYSGYGPEESNQHYTQPPNEYRPNLPEKPYYRPSVAEYKPYTSNQHYTQHMDEYRPRPPERPYNEHYGPQFHPQSDEYRPYLLEKPFNKPHINNYGPEHPNLIPDDYKPINRPPSNGYHNHPPYDNGEKVQTPLVSVSTGPYKLYLHPVHQILMGEGPHDNNKEMPPFDNSKFLNPYDDTRRPPYLPNRVPAYIDRYDVPYRYGPNYDYHHYRPNYDFDSYPPRPNYFQHHDYHRPRPPTYDYLFQSATENKPNETTVVESNNTSDVTTKKLPPAGNNIEEPTGKPIVTHSVGYHGEKITSIITELKEPCFRRVLAGKRVSRGFVKKSIICERIEDCQRECADEKNFVCEGFNYRLDSSGRGKGDCELLDLPLSRIDIGRDLYPDPDYDYYERDRNAASSNCHRGSGDILYYDKGGNRGYYDDFPPNRWYSGERRPPEDRWYERRPPPLVYDDTRRPPQPDRRVDHGWDSNTYRYNSNRRGDFAYHSHHLQQNYEHNHYDQDNHYLPPSPNYHRYQPPPHQISPLPRPTPSLPPYDYKSYEPYLPPRRYTITKYYVDRNRDQNFWSNSYGNGYGYNYNKSNRPDDFNRRNYYLPPKVDSPHEWGQYGGSYGGGFHNHIQYDYWGFNKFESGDSYGLLPPKHEPNYLPEHPHISHDNSLPKPIHRPQIPQDNYLPQTPYENFPPIPPLKHGGSYLPLPPNSNALLPAEPRYPPYNFIKDDCSLRTATGFRLHKGIVKKYFSVPNIYECELLCFKEKEFHCASYAYRYTISVTAPTDNCYLSSRNYKELDYYTDLQPDRDFDIYTMNNNKKCEQPLVVAKDNSVCYIGFGYPAKLLPQATRKSIRVSSEHDCKLECSKFRGDTLFQCMSFSFRTGHPSDQNCLLSDIYQRDLLPNVDYITDSQSWLFAWDNYNPECVALVKDHNIGGKNHGYLQDRYDYGSDPGQALGTWRVYSVRGFPCRRGTRCRENRETGFWFCELEGGDHNAWDYCCHPDHKCGYSEGYSYPWCYVGPNRSQWRKCSDRYYPYYHNYIDRYDTESTNWISHKPDRPPPLRPGIRPDRPPAPPTQPPARPSLDEYEMQFQTQFLDPPKPGGFGQSRHWPVSYLHKDKPPNTTYSESRSMKDEKNKENPKFAAIQNLIDVIKSNDLKNIQYQITNDSNKDDDILFVKIPLPTNFTREVKKTERQPLNTSVSDPIDFNEDMGKNTTNNKRSQKALPASVYRKSYIIRTNVTNYGKRH